MATNHHRDGLNNAKCQVQRLGRSHISRSTGAQANSPMPNDNMQFGAAAMRQFAKTWSFNITTSSPHHRKPNVMANRVVIEMKKSHIKFSFTSE